MRRKIRDTAGAWIGILLAVCLCSMTGCAGEKAPADSQGEKVSAGSRAPGSNGTLVEDSWRTKGFPVLEKTGEESALWATEYITWKHDDIDYDLSGESSLTELDGEKLGVSNGFVEGMYVTEPGKYVFRIQNEQEQIDKIIYSDLGDQTQIVDIMAAGLKMGGAGELGAECMCDAEGYIYTRNWNHQELYILDREGRLLMEYKGGDVTIEDPLRMPSGELLFPIKNLEDQSSQLVLFEPQQKKMYTVSSFETYPINSVYGIQGSDIYSREQTLLAEQ